MSLNARVKSLLSSQSMFNTYNQYHTTPCLNHVMNLTRMRVVDNSEIGRQAMAEGKPPKVIHVYNRTKIGTIGDKVLVAIKGEKKRDPTIMRTDSKEWRQLVVKAVDPQGIVVGVKKHQWANIPKMDTNNLVLIEDNGTPIGTRIHVPIPSMLRTILKEKTQSKGPDYTKLLAIATRFV